MEVVDVVLALVRRLRVVTVLPLRRCLNTIYDIYVVTSMSRDIFLV